MPHPDEIDYPYGGHAYIWVRPKTGTWDDIHPWLKGRGNEWRPARLMSHCPEHQYRGTQADGRTVEFFDTTFTYRLDKFEFGELINEPDAPESTLSVTRSLG